MYIFGTPGLRNHTFCYIKPTFADQNSFEILKLILYSMLCPEFRAGGKMAKTILIVEDYEDARVMMKVLVELCGYKTVEAEDGYEAIEKVKTYSPELIFMDLSMPRMDG